LKSLRKKKKKKEKHSQLAADFQDQGFKLLSVAKNLPFLSWPIYYYIYLAYTLAAMLVVAFTAWEAIRLHLRLNAHIGPCLVMFAVLSLSLLVFVGVFAAFASFGTLMGKQDYSSLPQENTPSAPLIAAVSARSSGANAPLIAPLMPPLSAPLSFSAPFSAPMLPHVEQTWDPSVAQVPNIVYVDKIVEVPQVQVVVEEKVIEVPRLVEDHIVCPACCPCCALKFIKQEIVEQEVIIPKEVEVKNTVIYPQPEYDLVPVLCSVCNTWNGVAPPPPAFNFVAADHDGVVRNQTYTVDADNDGVVRNQTYTLDGVATASAPQADYVGASSVPCASTGGCSPKKKKAAPKKKAAAKKKKAAPKKKKAAAKKK